MQDNKAKGKNKMLETKVDVLGIMVTIISIIVTCIGIMQTTKENYMKEMLNILE